MKKILTFLFLGLIFALTADAYATGAAVASLSTEHFQFPQADETGGFALSAFGVFSVSGAALGSWGVAVRDMINGKYLSVRSTDGFKSWVNNTDFSKDCIFQGQNPGEISRQAAETGFLHPFGNYELVPVYMNSTVMPETAEEFTVFQGPPPADAEVIVAVVPPETETSPAPIPPPAAPTTEATEPPVV